MKSYSQAGQDIFVRKLLDGPGTFLDIGCCHPTELSNTYALEQEGWTGLLIDNDSNAIELCRSVRKSPVVCCDATTVEWEPLLKYFGRNVGYLSLDVDGASLAVLGTMPLDLVRFSVLTVEHDSYRFGDVRRNNMRSILDMAGYRLICRDVCSIEGLPFEDWYVSSELVAKAARFNCTGKNWKEILDLP